MWRHAPRPVRGVMVRAVIGLTATAMIAATGSHFVMPDVKRVASYDILNVAAIDDSPPSTVGISEGSDWYYAVNDALSKPGITAAEIEAIRADVDQRLQSMLDIGVTNVRVLVPWANIEQKDPSLSQSTRNWNALDMIVNAANAKGMGILACSTRRRCGLRSRRRSTVSRRTSTTSPISPSRWLCATATRSAPTRSGTNRTPSSSGIRWTRSTTPRC